MLQSSAQNMSNLSPPGDVASEYEAAFRQWSDTLADNLEIQALVAAHIVDMETPEAKEVVGTVSSLDLEEQRREYEERLGNLIRVKSAKYTAKQEAQKMFEALREHSEESEKTARATLDRLESVELKAAEEAINRNYDKLDVMVVKEIIRKIRVKIRQWRRYNYDAIEAHHRKLRLEKQLHEQMIAAGRDVNLPFEEYRANLRSLQSRIYEKERQLSNFHEKERNSINELTHMQEKLDYLKSLEVQVKERTEEVDQIVAVNKDTLRRANIRRTDHRKQKAILHEKAEMLSKPALLEDMAKKIRLRNRLIVQISEAKRKFREFAEPNENDLHLMAKETLQALPETFENPETIKLISNYAGKANRFSELQVGQDLC